MRVRMLWLVALVSVLATAAAWGYPTLGGSTGLVTLPTAAVTPTGMVDLAADYQKVSDAKIMPLRASLGVTTNAEVWAGWTKITDGTDFGADTIWNIGAKYLLAQEPKNRASLAVGGSVGKAKDGEEVNLTQAFLVLSKNLALKQSQEMPLSGAKASVGMLWARASNGVDETLLSPFVGVELMGEKGANLAVEYRLKDSDLDSKAVLSAVLRYPLGGAGQPLWVELGMTNGAFAGLGGADNRLFVGVGYRLGVRSPSGPREPGTRSRPWGY